MLYFRCPKLGRGRADIYLSKGQLPPSTGKLWARAFIDRSGGGTYTQKQHSQL